MFGKKNQSEEEVVSDTASADAGGSFFDTPTEATPASKPKRAKKIKAPSNMFARRAKVTTRRRQTPAQSVAIKASRLRTMVFAVAAIVIGVGTLVVIETKPKPTLYTVYVLKTGIPAGQSVNSTEITAESSKSLLPGIATPSVINKSILISQTYAGEILQDALFAPRNSVPTGDVLVGLSLGSNKVPNSQLYPGEKIGIYDSTSSSGGQSVSGLVGKKTKTFAYGQEIVTASVVYAPTLGGSSGGANFDIAVPSKYAGLVSAAAANGQITIGVL
jgi:hypothetical protein